ncbi:MAG: DNA polymerase epsilon catalytic subunit A [Bacilli bacterium]|nr:DNA polymerase epsilon catalytic subunit A [Bacilli bacterium]
MKEMKKFINEHKKGCIIAVVALFVLLTAFFTIFFIIPSFGGNNYGHRLGGIENHKITNNVVNDIKDSITSKEGVSKVTYHNEGRILNFTITIDSNTKLEDAKGYAELVIKGISKKNLKYYDVQIFLDAKEDSNIYPIAGYKHKTSDEIVWGNVGGKSE